MSGLSNDPARCELMNLGYEAQGHGPYLIRQEGYVPGSGDMKMRHYILQRDGRWLLNFAFVMLPEAAQEEQLFHSINEASAFLDQLSAKPVRVDAQMPEGSGPEEIMVHFKQCARHILRGMRNSTVTRVLG